MKNKKQGLNNLVQAFLRQYNIHRQHQHLYLLHIIRYPRFKGQSYPLPSEGKFNQT